VYGDAWVSGDAWVYGDAQVYGNARVSGAAWVYGDAQVYGAAIIKLNGHNNCKTYLTLGPIGSNRFITFEKEHGIVNAGCFSGTIEEFIKAVKEKYGDRSDYYPVIEFLKSLT
jgi:hypothetical protein